jgi:hypothetical protein
MNSLYLAKTDEYKRDFSQNIADTLNAQLDYLKRAAQEGDTTDRGVIRAVAGAVKMVGELNLALHIADAATNKGHKKLQDGKKRDVYKLPPAGEIIEGNFDDIEIVEVDPEE